VIARPTWLPSGAALADRLPPGVQVWVARVRDVAKRAHEQGSALDAAGMAFFAALAVGPAAVVIGAFAGVLLTPEQITQGANSLAQVLPQGQSPMEPAIAALVQVSAKASAQAVSVTSVVGVAVALYASSRFLYGMRLAMQQAFNVDATQPGALVRLTAIIGTVVGLIVATAVLLLAALAGPIVRSLGVTDSGVLNTLVNNSLLAWLIIALLTLFVVRLALHRGPGVRVPVGVISPAVLLGTVWILGVSVGVTIYAARSSTLGVAIAVFGAPIVFLLWLYLCFMGILMAAHLHAQGLQATDSSAKPTQRTSAGEPARGTGKDRRRKPRDQTADTG